MEVMINFHKYEGAGNDFIMINNLKGDINLTSSYIESICDRHFGIGADGVIFLESSIRASCFMNYYNSDGTLAQMCGNGARCTAKFFIEQTNSNLNELSIDTRAGIKNIKANDDNTYSVNMGRPVFISDDFPGESITLERYNFDCVSMGNPHAVAIVENLDEIDLKSIGPKIENHEYFPNKINVEFVEKISDNFYKVKVWERGCGITLACGTGACAVYSILNKKENFDSEITLEFPGGKLFLSENPEGEIILRGPATFSFRGEI
jgi:diaminopimelate epimerase